MRSGLAGFDDITIGGIPSGRPTRVRGSSGSGELLARKPWSAASNNTMSTGVFNSLEECAADPAENLASLGFDLAALPDEESLFIDHVAIEIASR